MSAMPPQFTVAERLAAVIADLGEAPVVLQPVVRSLLIDVAGLCLAARHTDFMRATVQASDDPGECTVIGHAGPRSIAMAALCNGTAAHGEDFDDTFEGGPAHAGAVVVPALLADGGAASAFRRGPGAWHRGRLRR